MNKHLLFLCMVLALVLTGCTTTNSVVSDKANTTSYKYVSVMDNDTYRMPAELVQYQIQLYDAVEQSGLELVSPWRIDQLSSADRSKLLIATFAVSAKPEETVVTVNFMDYDSGRPLVSCQGAHSTLGISQKAEIKGAIRRVANEIAATFKK